MAAVLIVPTRVRILTEAVRKRVSGVSFSPLRGVHPTPGPVDELDGPPMHPHPAADGVMESAWGQASSLGSRSPQDPAAARGATRRETVGSEPIGPNTAVRHAASRYRPDRPPPRVTFDSLEMTGTLVTPIVPGQRHFHDWERPAGRHGTTSSRCRDRSVVAGSAELFDQHGILLPTVSGGDRAVGHRLDQLG